MDVDEAFSLISRAIDTGHVAHAYLIVGDLSGGCEELAHRILLKLFPNAIAQVEAGSHPDVVRLEPEGAKRIIKIDTLRDRMIQPLSLASFSGGWKVGVIVGADRMEAPTANAFLKSLEEPTVKTLYLLLTDHPESILPTIVSRTQRIELPRPEDLLTGEDYEGVAELFAEKNAIGLAKMLDEFKESLDPLEFQNIRKRLFKTLMSFVRQMMLSDKLPRFQAFRNIEAVEDAYRQSSERSMSSELVFSYLIDRIVFP